MFTFSPDVFCGFNVTGVRLNEPALTFGACCHGAVDVFCYYKMFSVLKVMKAYSLRHAEGSNLVFFKFLLFFNSVYMYSLCLVFFKLSLFIKHTKTDFNRKCHLQIFCWAFCISFIFYEFLF